MRTDIASGIVLVAIAVAYYVAIGEIADSTLSDEVGAGGLPRALAYVLAALGVILIARAAFAARALPRAQKEPEGEEDARMPRAVAFLMFGVAYIVLLPILGYFLSSALLIGAVALFEGARRPIVLPVTALAGAALYWALFVKLLGVNQPVGAIWRGLIS